MTVSASLPADDAATCSTFRHSRISMKPYPEGGYYSETFCASCLSEIKMVDFSKPVGWIHISLSGTDTRVRQHLHKGLTRPS
ncbi:uncharacterized protein [Lolium perenne]|uniref:uncharacterized protein isoform X3 n=1 Tax=Lolium perenne TaxID=4522 RepID=UPI0021F627B4|nr:uncharacterized protein LOC127334531 isoform X2 [Lolium perenne]XP_051216977.1 uncharacterized protein LOC127334531 isoform X2 [Lolium perenne]XP_051216978.1 uncharacterized protein LOC127334531 isoform X2 [Lolium perenne]